MPTEASHLISSDIGALIHLGPDGATLPDLLGGWQSLHITYATFFDYLTTALLIGADRCGPIGNANRCRLGGGATGPVSGAHGRPVEVTEERGNEV
jgi:hypothetical protein